VRGLITKKKVILANNLMGYLDGAMTFEIKEGNQIRRASNSENLVNEKRRRRTSKNLIRIKREHSV
jgi:hypothetical protein